jgi:exopolysaccharide production protein ExoQ
MLLEFVAMVVVIARWRRVSPILRRNWAIGLFFLYAGMSISWSDYQLVSFKHWIKAIGDVMMVLIILTEPSVTGAFKRVVTRLGFVLLPLSILFIRYYPELGRRVTNSWTLEPTGVCDQKNSLGILCYIIGLGLLWRFRSSYNDREDPSRRRRLLALGIVLAMAVWLLHTCNSLTSICALSMASIAMLLSNLRVFRRIPALAHCLILVTLGISVYALFFQSSGALVEDLGRDRTLSGRSTGWLIILGIPHNHLVGSGYESFWLGSRLQMVWDAFPGMKIGQAHNGYIEIALNLGWIGIAMLALLIVTGYRNVIGAYRLDPDIGGLRISYFVAVLTNGLTEGIFKMMTPPWIFFLLATAVAQWIPQRKGSPAARKTHSLVAASPYAVCEQTPIGY